MKELEEKLGFGDAVGRLAGDEPFGDPVGSTMDGYSVDATAAMTANLRIQLF